MGELVWDLLSLFSKILLYGSVAAAIGACFTYRLLSSYQTVLLSVLSYLRWACVLGIINSGANFFIQVGAFAEQGIAGVIDVVVISIIAQTAIADVTMMRIIGFLLIGMSSFQVFSIPLAMKFKLKTLLSLAGIAVLILSFAKIGHLAESTVLAKMAILLHILAMSIWIGSLYPLYKVCRTENSATVQTIMDQFGRLAMVFVILLLLCGIYLCFVLFNSLDQLLSSDYGRGLLLKIVFASSLLALGAINKFRLVPGLHRDGYKHRLSQVIVFECILGFIVFSITAILTTLIGIE